MRLLFSLCLLFTTVFMPLDIYADSPPIPKNKAKALSSFNQRIVSEEDKKDSLLKKSKSIENDISNTKNKLIDIAKAIQNNENSLKDFEQRIANLELKKSILEDQLHSDRASISKLILALERIRRTPPEAMLARPDTPYKTAQSAMLMGRIVPSVNRHAEKLNKNLETLVSVTRELEIEKKELLATSNDLIERHKEMMGLVNKRTHLYTKTNNDIKAREASIQSISLQAKNLEDLVSRIKQENDKEEALRARANIKKRKKTKLRIKDDGTTRLPISGIIRTSYNQKDNLGANSKGLTIEGRTGALVVAPMSGKIQFTGAFNRYGNIVIIEHANGYHSLVAGMDKINSIVGDSVKLGEPIGLLPNSSLIPRPTLYYELRKNGKPVNPSIKFPDLG